MMVALACFHSAFTKTFFFFSLSHTHLFFFFFFNATHSDHHDADGNVGALLAEYTQWKQANKKLLENEKAKEELLGKKSAIKALWETSSD